MPARLPDLRLRLRADDARDAASRRSSVGGRGRPQPARAVRAAESGDEGWLASRTLSRRSPSRSFVRAAREATANRRRLKTRPKPKARARGRSGFSWIAVSGILLAGVVFVNVAVLRLNLSLDSTNSERTKLRAENAALQSNLSRELASSQIQTRAAKQDGLATSDPSTYGYVNHKPLDEADKQANRRIRLLLAIFVARLRGDARARRVAAGRARREPGEDGGAAAPRDDRHPRRPRDDLRRRRRAARDRRADDDGLRRPAPADRAAGDRGRGAEVPRRRRELALPAAAEPQDELPLHQALRRSQGGRRVPEEGLRRRELLSRGEARVPAALRRVAGDRLRRHRQQGARRARGAVRPQPDGQDRASRRSSATRSAARSTSSARRPSSRATTSSRRSTTRSRRTPKPCCARRWRSGTRRSATAIVLDPKTGAVLAMAQAPGYDANKSNTVPFALQRNRAVTDTYEPGSTFKLVTVAGALSTRARQPRDQVHAAVLDPGRRPRHPRRRAARHRDADRRADPPALVERRRDHDRREARLVSADGLDQRSSASAKHRDRLPR